MNRLQKNLILCCAAVGFSSLTLMANAHDMQGACKDQADKRACYQAQIEKRQTERQAKWHDELKITAAQEPAWKAFTDSFQPLGSNSEHPPRLSREEAEKAPAPERMEQHITRMENHLAAMKTHHAALKTFYAQLTPEQQTIFNKKMAHFEHQKHRHERHGHTHHDNQKANSQATDIPATSKP